MIAGWEQSGQVTLATVLASAQVLCVGYALKPTCQKVTSCSRHAENLFESCRFWKASLAASIGRVPIIDANPRRDAGQKVELQAEEKRRKLLNWETAEDLRYHERTAVERVNARLKDEFGGRMVRVRGNAKVMCHLMFGIVALAVDQIVRLAT